MGDFYSVKPEKRVCPNCCSIGLTVFYEIEKVPVHSVLLHESRQEAVDFPKGDIRLGFCHTCGFITNISYDPTLQSYLSQKYESTQAYSDTFNAFHRGLALRLIDQYKLHGKKIVEIGCGQGEFLDLLCNLGGNTGVGFDPAYVDGNLDSSARDRITVIKDYYTEENSQQYKGDFVCCKMTLEHIHEPYLFVNMVSRSVRNQPETIVFFQVPNAQHVLQEVAFWDIYYEHCSYFSLSSLQHLFLHCGFDVINQSIEYDEQYLMIEARSQSNKVEPVHVRIDELSKLEEEVAYFQSKYKEIFNLWRDSIRNLFRNGKKIVLWGGGSKAVAFLTSLSIGDEIEYIVDINPKKHGTFSAGTGNKIVTPDYLMKHQPDVVIVMNPIYLKEIEEMLNGLGIAAELVSINAQSELATRK